jgi:hypothetical protein
MAMGTAFTECRPRFVRPRHQEYAVAMRTALLIAGLLVSLVAWPQEIYRWVDKDGIVHYADQPGAPDAVLVPYISLGTGPQDAGPPDLYQSEPQAQPAGPTYQSLRITSPAADESFYGADVSVDVRIQLDRDLRPGDQLVVFIDGQRTPEFSGTVTTLTGLTRGTHYLRAAVLDKEGSVVITSPQINFHLRQASIATPPTGPSVNLPARPTGPRPTPLPGRAN